MQRSNESEVQATGTAGQANPGPGGFVDLNHNGIPDYEEGWFWRALYEVGRFFVITFAGEKTRAMKAVQYIDGQTGRASP